MVSLQRVVSVVVLVVLAMLSLRIVASVLDAQGNQSWTLPVQLVLMAVIGAVLGFAVPRLAGARASRRRSVLVGAAAGVGAAVLGLVVFFVLLSGLGGA